MKPYRSRKFVYRVKVVLKDRQDGTFLAEVSADLDETARRKIVSKEMEAGGRVVSIQQTQDRTEQPGDWRKRSYA